MIERLRTIAALLNRRDEYNRKMQRGAHFGAPRILSEWARKDSNLRPRPYQGRALAS